MSDFARKIWEQVQANQAKLRACPRPHVFPPKEKGIGKRYTCLKCGGDVDAIARLWYEEGFKDAQKGDSSCGPKSGSESSSINQDSDTADTVTRG